MAEIDHMYNLINTILDDKEVVIFLGGGASMEGKQNEKSFPGSDELMNDVLKKFGEDKGERKSKKKRLNSFLKIIEKWEKEDQLPVRLRKFLDGEPGLAHYYLAALSIALSGDSNALLYLTKNYDDLMIKAFMDILRKKFENIDIIPTSLSPEIKGSQFKKIVSSVEGHIKEGRPVIIKLFGDLNSQSPIFKQDDMKFEPEAEKKIVEWMKKTMIVIGYSFSDNIIKDLLISARGQKPVFLINPLKRLPASIKELDRVHHIKSKFSDFATKLLETIQERNPSINRKIDKILEFLDPTLLYPDFNAIETRVKQCSIASLSLAKDKMPKIEVNGKSINFAPIPREDTGPNFERFIQSDRPLLAIIGDSGSGKSTLLYSVANNEHQEKFVTLFYDVHHLQHAGSLTEKLLQDFRCEQRQLETIFEHFQNVLSKENKILLIIIDGLNESIQIDPSNLKGEIESLGAKLPETIKIVYSCRTVYWNSYIKINGLISSVLYHDSKEFQLHFFSEREANLAFAVYKKIYKYKGGFKSLKAEFKEKIRDPLMLRMLAEGYQGENLPSFAPAVKIFKTYEDLLYEKFEGSTLMDFIEELIAQKIVEAADNPMVTDQFDKRSIRRNNILSELTQQQISINKRKPLILLEDEGILSALDAKKRIYRFTYDRFFEYLLGKEIGNHMKVNSRRSFIQVLSKKISDFQRAHFSFLQGLKSEIIRRNIEEPDGFWSFYNPDTIKTLLYDSDAAVVNFSKEILRELTFEAEKDTFDVFKKVANTELEWKVLSLDIAGDSPKIKPILIEGLFSGNKYFVRRCIEILSVINDDSEVRINIENSILSEVCTNEFTSNHSMGLIYYTSVIFLLEDRVDNDPVPKVKIFWNKVIGSVKSNQKTVKQMINCEFLKILKSEGPLFFSEESKEEGMEYFWTGIEEKEREIALKMLPLLVDETLEINDERQEILCFFGSFMKYFEKRKEPENNIIYNYKIEYEIAQWILIQRSKYSYSKVKKILERFTENGPFASTAFALCVMQYILRFVHFNNRNILVDGFETMKRWTKLLEKKTERFYIALKGTDPFEINAVPLEMTTTLDAILFAPKDGPIGFLEEYLNSSDSRNILLSILALRYCWREYPGKVLGTIELVIDSQIPIVVDWLERFLKEIYLVYPRLVENFFWKNNFSLNRIQRIKFRADVLDSRSVEHGGYTLYKALFLKKKDRRIAFADWYKKIFQSSSLDSYCNDLLEFFFEIVLE